MRLSQELLNCRHSLGVPPCHYSTPPRLHSPNKHAKREPSRHSMGHQHLWLPPPHQLLFYPTLAPVASPHHLRRHPYPQSPPTQQEHAHAHALLGLRKKTNGLQKRQRVPEMFVSRSLYILQTVSLTYVRATDLGRDASSVVRFMQAVDDATVFESA